VEVPRLIPGRARLSRPWMGRFRCGLGRGARPRTAV